MYRPYISKQLNNLPKETREFLIATDEKLTKLGKELQADLVAAARDIIDQQHDTLFARYGVKIIRETEPRRKTSPYLMTVLKEVSPVLERFNQESVQPCADGLYTPENASVQTGISTPPPYMFSETEKTSLAGGRASVSEDSQTQPPDSPARPLMTGLVQRGYTPDEQLVDALYRELADTPDEYFWLALDQRNKRGRIGNGLLQSTAKKAYTNYSAVRASIADQEKRNAESRRAETERAERMSREILADPKATEQDREWANEILHTTQVA